MQVKCSDSHRIILATLEAEVRRIMIRGWLRQKDPVSNITRAKRVGAEAEDIEYLPSKHKALGSNPVPPQKKCIPFFSTMNMRYCLKHQFYIYIC
jgi:hypothetical protein